MNRDGGSARVITGDFDRDVNASRWSPDGTAIWFLADERGNSGIWRADLRGKVERVAGNVGSSTSAYGGGGAFTIASDGAYAMTYTRPDVPGDVAVGRAGAGDASPKVLTSVNADLFAGRALGSLEEIVYKSSKDGREIQGWILKPPDFDASKRYPLVLEIHGGPFANYGDRFDLEKQLMAARVRRALHQPTRVDQLRAGVRESDSPRLSRRRLPRPELRGRRDGGEGVRRSPPALCHRR